MTENKEQQKPSSQSEPDFKIWPEGVTPPEGELYYRVTYTVSSWPAGLKLRVIGKDEEV